MRCTYIQMIIKSYDCYENYEFDKRYNRTIKVESINLLIIKLQYMRMTVHRIVFTITIILYLIAPYQVPITTVFGSDKPLCPCYKNAYSCCECCKYKHAHLDGVYFCTCKGNTGNELSIQPAISEPVVGITSDFIFLYTNLFSKDQSVEGYKKPQVKPPPV